MVIYNVNEVLLIVYEGIIR